MGSERWYRIYHEQAGFDMAFNNVTKGRLGLRCFENEVVLVLILDAVVKPVRSEALVGVCRRELYVRSPA